MIVVWLNDGQKVRVPGATKTRQVRDRPEEFPAGGFLCLNPKGETVQAFSLADVMAYTRDTLPERQTGDPGTEA